jgi:hypothetical protein
MREGAQAHAPMVAVCGTLQSDAAAAADEANRKCRVILSKRCKQTAALTGPAATCAYKKEGQSRRKLIAELTRTCVTPVGC